MTPDECRQRLQSRGVGRIGVLADRMVEIYPVNYVVDGDDVVVRVRRGGQIDVGSQEGAWVALQIDHADARYHEGWGVLVHGHCTHVDDPDELARLARLPLTPWGDAGRTLFLRISMESVTGMRIHHQVR
jgi:nitroimidazol reductase NimA-like FMN-containing flavoprotein (pyridoxamine 5'-phosphate oxidase superfamily)